MTENSIHPVSRLRRTAFLGVLLLVIFTGFFGARALLAAASAPKPIGQMDQKDIIDRYGVRFTMLAATADGGLVDIRFVIEDPIKAERWASDTNAIPKLYNEKGMEVSTNSMGDHSHNTYEGGRQYWMLYYNTGSAIKNGSIITFKIGNNSLENVLVQ
jgi:hypothetical protein